jgi:hypothetical protein
MAISENIICCHFSMPIFVTAALPINKITRPLQVMTLTDPVNVTAGLR